MAKGKRGAEAAPTSSKRSRKATTATAAAAEAAPEPSDAAAEQHQAATAAAAAAGSRRRARKPAGTSSEAQAAASPDADAAAAAAGAAGSSKQQQRKGKSKAAAAAGTAAAAAKEAARTGKAAGKKQQAKSGAGADGAAGGSSKPKPPYYLVKSEPDEFSIQMLKQRPDQTEGWEGVRNYVARNHLRGMRLGDRAFFYHSSCKVPGIVGIVEVVREAYPDLTAQDKGSKYYDPKASPEDPRWSMVDFKLVRELRRQVTLEELKAHKGPGGALAGMALFTTARLSVQPVSEAEWEFVLGLEQQGEAADT